MLCQNATRRESTSALEFVEVGSSKGLPDLAQAVEEGLAGKQKTLPARFFYDSVGSELFERITQLPEYYLTRKERSILERNADEIIAAVGDDLALIEFGSGSSIKTRLLIQSILQNQQRLLYSPIDISSSFLREASRALLEDYAGLSVRAIAGEYHQAIRALPAHPGPRLILFLGSNIGNFEQLEAIDFLSKIRARMEPEDRILLGIDLRKPASIIEPAYNDAAGVTAAFNKNILTRINRELGGHFDLDAFEHQAPFIASESRIEMRLVSKARHQVRIDALGAVVEFREGEWIHTENSHKYTETAFAELIESAGLTTAGSWSDKDRWFAVKLLERA